MTEEAKGPILYRVVYSERVRLAFQELIGSARQRGLGSLVLDAIKEIDRLLHLYPQFGEPLIELTQEPGQVWHGTIPPLVVRYVLYEDKRLVMVAVPILPLPNSGL